MLAHMGRTDSWVDCSHCPAWVPHCPSQLHIWFLLSRRSGLVFWPLLAQNFVSVFDLLFPNPLIWTLYPTACHSGLQTWLASSSDSAPHTQPLTHLHPCYMLFSTQHPLSWGTSLNVNTCLPAWGDSGSWLSCLAKPPSRCRLHPLLPKPQCGNHITILWMWTAWWGRSLRMHR